MEVWDACVLACIKKLDASTDVAKMIRAEVHEAAGKFSDCRQCSKRLNKKVLEVTQLWTASRAEIELVSVSVVILANGTC